MLYVSGRHRRAHVATALVFCIGLVARPVPSAGQADAQRRLTRVPAPVGPSGRTEELYAGSYALLVGVSRYQSASWSTLESVPAELEELRRTLKESGFDVIDLVMNPTGTELRRAVEDFIGKYGYERGNRLLFFFSGHGHTLDNGQRGYFVPRDAPDPQTDEAGFRRIALSMQQVDTWARDLVARHALFAFDSCFSGTIFRTRERIVPERISQFTARPVREFMSAGSAGEPVPARSVFTPVFIRGVRGQADLDGDGFVTGTELGNYVQREVIAYRTRQTPQFGKIRDPQLDEGEFVFAVPPPGPTPLESALAAGKSALDSGDIDGAEREYRNAIGIDASNNVALEALNRISSIRSVRARAAQAAGLIDTATQLFRNNGDVDAALEKVGEALKLVPDEQRALGLQRQLTQLKTIQASSMIASAAALVDKASRLLNVDGDVGGALEQVNQALKLVPGDARALALQKQLLQIRSIASSTGDKRGADSNGAAPAESAASYERSCLDGNASDCAHLAYMHAEGTGAPKDDGRALELFQRACNGGHARSCSELGVRWANGRGVSKDPVLAVQLFERSCNSGFAMGCVNLAIMYESGTGVARDDARAVQLYQQNCSSAAARGCSLLGRMYATGRGVPVDADRARQLYQQGCDADDAMGCFSVATAYERGLGVARDRGNALQWFRKACALGDASGCEAVKRLGG